MVTKIFGSSPIYIRTRVLEKDGGLYKHLSEVDPYHRNKRLIALASIGLAVERRKSTNTDVTSGVEGPAKKRRATKSVTQAPINKNPQISKTTSVPSEQDIQNSGKPHYSIPTDIPDIVLDF